MHLDEKSYYHYYCRVLLQVVYPLKVENWSVLKVPN